MVFPPASVEMDLPHLNDRPIQPWIFGGPVGPFLADSKAFPFSLVQSSVRSCVSGVRFDNSKCHGVSLAWASNSLQEPLCRGTQRTSPLCVTNLAVRLQPCQTSDLQQMPTLHHPESAGPALSPSADRILQEGSSHRHHDHSWSGQETEFVSETWLREDSLETPSLHRCIHGVSQWMCVRFGHQSK